MDGVRLETSPVEVLASVPDALSRGPHGSFAERSRIYNRLLAEAESRTAAPDSADEAINRFRLRVLRTAIKAVELDIRAGVDVFADNYRPAQFDERVRKLQPSRGRERPAAPAAGPQNERRLEPDEFLPTLIAALSLLPQDQVGERRKAYASLRDRIERGFANGEISAETVELQRSQFRTAVRLLETDINAGVDIHAEGYRPANFDLKIRRFLPPQESQARAAEPDNDPLLLEPEDFIPTLLGALSHVRLDQIGERQKVYNSLRDRHDRGVACRDLPAETAEYYRKLFRVALRLVDNDIRANVDVFAEGYRPADLEERFRKLQPSHGTRSDLFATPKGDGDLSLGGPEDFVPAILAGLARVKHGDPGERRKIYIRLRDRHERGLAAQEQTQEAVEFQCNLFRVAIRQVETDIRAGVNVFDPGYSPAGLNAKFRRLQQSRERPNNQAAEDATEVEGEPLELEPDDLLPTVIAALSKVALDKVGERRRVYDSLRERHERGLTGRGLAEETMEFQRKLLRVVIRLVESDIRAGVDVMAPGYAPAELSEAFEKQGTGHRRTTMLRKAKEAREIRRRSFEEDIYYQVELQPGEEEDLEALRWRLAYLHAAPLPNYVRSPSLRTLAIFIPLLIFQLRSIQAESRIALLWNLMGPALLLGLISSLYILAGFNFIMNMDVPTFALLGATTWIMFRIIIFRTSTSFLSARSIMNFDAVTPLSAAITCAFVWQLIYLAVFSVLLFGGYGLGLITLTTHWFPFIGYVLMMGAGAAAIGVIFGSIAVLWPFFLRFAPLIERFLAITSAVFFISEQLPEQLRPYMMWSPFAHGIQLMRAAYFPGYRTADSSFAYFCVWVILLGAIGYAAEKFVRSDVQPI